MASSEDGSIAGALSPLGKNLPTANLTASRGVKGTNVKIIDSLALLHSSLIGQSHLRTYSGW